MINVANAPSWSANVLMYACKLAQFFLNKSRSNSSRYAFNVSTTSRDSPISRSNAVPVAVPTRLRFLAAVRLFLMFCINVLGSRLFCNVNDVSSSWYVSSSASMLAAVLASVLASVLVSDTAAHAVVAGGGAGVNGSQGTSNRAAAVPAAPTAFRVADNVIDIRARVPSPLLLLLLLLLLHLPLLPLLPLLLLLLPLLWLVLCRLRPPLLLPPALLLLLLLLLLLARPSRRWRWNAVAFCWRDDRSKARAARRAISCWSFILDVPVALLVGAGWVLVGGPLAYSSLLR